MPVIPGPGERRVDKGGTGAGGPLVGQDGSGGDVRGAVGNVERGAEAGSDRQDADVTPTAANEQERVVVTRQVGSQLRTHGVDGGVTQVRTEDRAAGVEDRLLVHQPVDDIELVRRGDPDLDVGGERAIHRCQVPHRDGVHPAEAEGDPRRLGRRVADRHVGDVVGDAPLEGRPGEVAEERGVGRTGRDGRGDGVAVDEVQRRALRRVPRHRRPRVGDGLDRRQEAGEGPTVADDRHAVTERERAPYQFRRSRRILVGGGEEREPRPLPPVPRHEQGAGGIAVRASQRDDTTHAVSGR